MDGLVDELIEKLDNFLGRILFMIERLVCLFISWLQQLFNVFTGVKRAQYNGKDEYLIDVFFGNSIVYVRDPVTDEIEEALFFEQRRDESVAGRIFVQIGLELRCISL